MPEVLELPHLVEQDGVPQVQIGRGRIEPGLDPQGPAGAELLEQLVFTQHLVRAPHQLSQLLRNLAHLLPDTANRPLNWLGRIVQSRLGGPCKTRLQVFGVCPGLWLY